MKAVIVTGDRKATPEQWGWVIAYALADREVDVVLHGGAKGIDTIAEAVFGLTEVFAANWSVEHRAAGPIRNQRMLRRLQELMEHGYEVEVLAFHDDIDTSRGTRNMCEQARKAGVHVSIWSSDGESIETSLHGGI